MVEQLGSSRFKEREEAGAKLAGRDDALPALKQALQSPDPEVRQRAEQLIEQIETRLLSQKRQRLLTRVRNGEADLFIDQISAMTDQVDDKTWQALADLAKAIHEKANRQSGKKTRLPEIATHWQHVKCVKVPDPPEQKGFEIRGRALARNISSDWALIARSILVCQGSIHGCPIIGHSIVFANGDISVFEPREVMPGVIEKGVGSISDSIVFCDGSIETDDAANSILIATGTVKIKGVNNGDVVVIERAREALDLLKVYHARQAGVEVAASEAGVTVTKILEGSPFARAGFREGDAVLAADGAKVADPEEFRKCLRRATAADKEVLLRIRRETRTLEIPIRLEE